MDTAEYRKNAYFVQAGDILVDRENNSVSVGNQEVELTPSLVQAIDVFARLKDLILTPPEFCREYYNDSRRSVNDQQAKLLTNGVIDRLRKIFGNGFIRSHAEQCHSFSGSISMDFINYGGLLFSPSTNCVSVDNRIKVLTRDEAKILFALAQEPNRVFKRQEIRDILRSGGEGVDDPSDNSVDIHMTRIRKKTGKQFIRSIYGVGHKFGG